MRSFPVFAVLFLVIPILEIYILIKVGSSEMLGPLWTIFLVVFTAVVGAFLLRQQGLSTLARLQGNLSQGKIPAQEMVEGVLLAVGGALLMTPGFVTDTIGFLCLLPFSRKFFAKGIIKRSTLQMNAQMGGFSQGSPFQHHQQHQHPNDTNIYEGEYTEVEDDPSFIPHDDKR